MTLVTKIDAIVVSKDKATKSHILPLKNLVFRKVNPQNMIHSFIHSNFEYLIMSNTAKNATKKTQYTAYMSYVSYEYEIIN